MTWIKEKAIAHEPLRVLGVIDQEFRIEYIDEIRRAKRTAGMSRISFFYHFGNQHAQIVGGRIHCR